jgi:hypothetical protein
MQKLINWNLLHDPSAQVYKDWAEGLRDISDRHLSWGTRKAAKFTGYFTLGEFIKLCTVTAEDLNLPNVTRAFQQAATASTPKINQVYTHPIVYLAGVATGWFDISQGGKEVFERYKYNYEVLVGRLIRGEELDMPVPVALPAKKHEVSSDFTAAMYLDELNRMFPQ